MTKRILGTAIEGEKMVWYIEGDQRETTPGGTLWEKGWSGGPETRVAGSFPPVGVIVVKPKEIETQAK
jgi:hypothetical protein